MNTRSSLLTLTVLALLGCSPLVTNVGAIVDAGPPSTLTATGRVCTTAGWRLLGSQLLAVLMNSPSIKLDRELLCSHSGEYQLTPEIKGTIRCEGEELVFERAGRPARHFRAEVADVLFEPGAPRTRRIFLRDGCGTVDRCAERREARDVVWTGTK